MRKNLSIEQLERLLISRRYGQIHLKHMRSELSQDTRSSIIVASIDKIDDILEANIPQSFKSQIPKNLPMKEIHLYTNNPANPKLEKLFVYLVKIGYQVIIDGLKFLKRRRKPARRGDYILINKSITPDHFGALMNDDYFNRYIKNQHLQIIQTYPGRYEVADKNNAYWLINKTWIK